MQKPIEYGENIFYNYIAVCCFLSTFLNATPLNAQHSF